MTTYLLFSGDYYYPLGGASDLDRVIEAGSLDDAIAQAKDALVGRRIDWAQLFDLTTKTIEWYFNKDEG